MKSLLNKMFIQAMEDSSNPSFDFIVVMPRDNPTISGKGTNFLHPTRP